MKVLYFDCSSGISGDMTVGALLDLGVDKTFLIDELQKLNFDGYKIDVKQINKNGIMATSFDVIIEHDHHHHDHDHHEHDHHDHRSLGDILKLIDESDLNPNVKDLSKKIFYRIGEAEAKVHGRPVDEVHFHEVGAIDSIVDIVGVAICIDVLSPDVVYSSVVNDGYGTTYCQHGKIPIPVPAVVEIFANAGVRFKQVEIPKELVTPTGAGIIAQLAKDFGLMPEMKITQVGMGAGKRDLETPNVLRIYMGETAQENSKEERITVIETNIDDTTAEILGYTMERLFEAGAKDVFFTNIQMKKNRPAVKLTVLCKNDERAVMEHIIFTETTAIGVRVREESRTVLPRKSCIVKTPYGDVSGKSAIFENIEKITIEYEDAKSLAIEKNIPVKNILQYCTKKY